MLQTYSLAKLIHSSGAKGAVKNGKYSFGGLVDFQFCRLNSFKSAIRTIDSGSDVYY